MTNSRKADEDNHTAPVIFENMIDVTYQHCHLIIFPQPRGFLPVLAPIQLDCKCLTIDRRKLRAAAAVCTMLAHLLSTLGLLHIKILLDEHDGAYRLSRPGLSCLGFEKIPVQLFFFVACCYVVRTVSLHI